MIFFRSLVYLAWLGKEIISGTGDVLFSLFKSGEYGKPMIVEFPLRCVTDVEVVLMASSITITPGTLVVATGSGNATEPPTLFVHCMFAQSESDALEGLSDMEDRLLKALRGRTAGSDGKTRGGGYGETHGDGETRGGSGKVSAQ